MRIANLKGRSVLVRDDLALDISTASDGRFPADIQDLYPRWDEVRAWSQRADFTTANPFDPADLDNPTPRPLQVFAIGVNYRDHAAESNLPVPDDVVVFTKFQSSFTSPDATVQLPSDRVDYETELVAVIGREARHVPAGHGWDHIAGLSIGQDYCERTLQLAAAPPQFSLGKSFPDFSPVGPVVVTPDELENADALPISAVLERDDTMTVLQAGTTADLVFGVPALVERLSQIVTLWPGDVVFTGTPAGVGLGRGQFLQPGDALTSCITGIGEMRNTFVASPSRES